MVAEDDVLARTGIDRVVTLAADDDVVAGVVGDDVALAEHRAGVDALDHIERDEVGVGRTEVVGRAVAHVAMVTEDHVGAGAAVDAVDALPTKQAIAPGIALDQVVVAVRRFDCMHVVNLRRARQLDARGCNLQRQETAITLQHPRDVDAEH